MISKYFFAKIQKNNTKVKKLKVQFLFQLKTFVYKNKYLQMTELIRTEIEIVEVSYLQIYSQFKMSKRGQQPENSFDSSQNLDSNLDDCQKFDLSESPRIMIEDVGRTDLIHGEFELCENIDENVEENQRHIEVNEASQRQRSNSNFFEEDSLEEFANQILMDLNRMNQRTASIVQDYNQSFFSRLQDSPIRMLQQYYPEDSHSQVVDRGYNQNSISSNHHQNGHPSKNFLQKFRKPHKKFLIQQFGEEVLQNPLLNSRTNRRYFQDLYSVEEFKPAFEKFFRKRVLYRDLMQSRKKMSLETKIHYFTLLPVFQRAFREGEFDHIN